MRELEKQLEPWMKSARSDLDTAALLINEARLAEGLFFCCLAIEKGLKAHAVRLTGKFPQFSCDLEQLLNMTHIHVGGQDRELLAILMQCQAELRDPERDTGIPTANQAFDYLDRARELLLWLERTL
jgi:HEPN domain-containing protein